MEDLFHSAVRRTALLNIMNDLKEQSINCFQCKGVCCTFEANSMMITPLESLELYLYLCEQKRWNESLVALLNQIITRYRLDVELQTHKQQIMRKTYTCPFYNEGPKGCSISRKIKPYGCLGFNPLTTNCSGNGGCDIYRDELVAREDMWEATELQVNNFLKERLQLHWSKIDICRGLIDLDKRKDLLDSEFLQDVGRLLEQ